MADPYVRTYDPKLVTVTFMGLVLSGFAEGTFITAKPAGPAFKRKRGGTGTVDRVNTNTFELDIELALKQTAEDNGDLSTIAAADALSNTGKGVFQIKDLGGTTLVYAPQAWISESATVDMGDDLTPRKWKFETGPASKFVGGNF